MATYKKGFKKTSGDLILLKTIVAIIVVVLAVVGIVFVYDVATDKGDYADFTAIAAYDKILTQTGTDSQQIPDYAVYFYNADDQDCLDIQRKVLRLAEKMEAKGLVIFFVDLDAVKETATGDQDDFLDAIQKSSTFLNRSPMLVTVADGEFDAAYEGADAVVDTLTQIYNGEYTPFN